jgi:SPP1 family phage portal protein
MRSEDIIRLLQKHGDEYLNKIVTREIADHQSLHNELKSNYEKYAGKVPILNRVSVDKLGIRVNKTLANDYRGDIVDQFKGFVFGEQITVNYEAEDPKIATMIKEFITSNSIAAMDTELAEFMLSAGQTGRLLYIEAGTGIIKAKNLKPWEVIFIMNSSKDKIDYAIIYYPYTDVNYDSGKETKTYKAEWYDKENVYYFVKRGSRFEKESGMIVVEGELREIINPQPHFFEGVPLIKFISNSREQNVFAKVETLIDGYDEGLSDWLNEVIEFRNSYMKATGAEMTEEERILARKTGIINLPDKDTNVDFLVKNLSPEFIERALSTIDNNIYKFAKSMNMGSEKFVAGGPESGESRKWRMLNFVFEGIVIERFFTKSLQEQWRLICSNWNLKSTKVDYLKISFEFSRTLPVDLLYLSDVLTKLWGKVPKKIIYSLMPFIDNPQEVIDMLEDENDIDLDKIEALKMMNTKTTDE